ncbi:hypothetical protein FB382_000995 [Nocardioides ginsengisegetis]|uniref:Uncharacterized protein n=1 Tax=Nocardioides ginsengisegetis TaxID=661491 RepID=A0A7W3IY82_9ACTN|nr:hypothetical protein [Nocardioides ginsengisegetis]MBA8802704.1 hypothetical protein [Nocardioides ginsengisegetis]
MSTVAQSRDRHEVLHAVDFDLHDTTFRYPEGGPRLCRADLSPRSDPVLLADRGSLEFCPVCVAAARASCEAYEIFGEELTDIEWRTVSGRWLQCEPSDLPGDLAELYWDDVDIEPPAPGRSVPEPLAEPTLTGPAHAYAEVVRLSNSEVWLIGPGEGPAAALEHPAGVRPCVASMAGIRNDRFPRPEYGEYCPVCVSVVLGWLYARASVSGVDWCIQDGTRVAEPARVRDVAEKQGRKSRQAAEAREEKRHETVRQLRRRGSELLAQEWTARHSK